ATGPVSYYYYMQLCLSHPEFGYYMSPTNPIIGEGAGLVTSPEISQIFGEVCSALFQWIMAGCPAAVSRVDLGSGKGTIHWALQLFVVENSRALRQIQSDTISKIRRGGWDPSWLDSIQDIEPSSAFTMVMAHEFFDALPVDIFKRTEEGWNEVKIGVLASNEENTLPRLQTILEPQTLPRLRP
ncbi:S-adenosyl-L-methionine-dependent methyltransferase, partial [Flagelloscypha sp. PMI_526]